MSGTLDGLKIYPVLEVTGYLKLD